MCFGIDKKNILGSIIDPLGFRGLIGMPLAKDRQSGGNSDKKQATLIQQPTIPQVTVTPNKPETITSVTGDAFAEQQKRNKAVAASTNLTGTDLGLMGGASNITGAS